MLPCLEHPRVPAAVFPRSHESWLATKQSCLSASHSVPKSRSSRRKRAEGPLDERWGDKQGMQAGVICEHENRYRRVLGW